MHTTGTCVDMTPTFSDMDIQNTPIGTFKNSTPLSTFTAQISFFVYYLAWSFPQNKKKINSFIYKSISENSFASYYLLNLNIHIY